MLNHTIGWPVIKTSLKRKSTIFLDIRLAVTDYAQGKELGSQKMDKLYKLICIFTRRMTGKKCDWFAGKKIQPLIINRLRLVCHYYRIYHVLTVVFSFSIVYLMKCLFVKFCCNVVLDPIVWSFFGHK